MEPARIIRLFLTPAQLSYHEEHYLRKNPYLRIINYTFMDELLEKDAEKAEETGRHSIELLECKHNITVYEENGEPKCILHFYDCDATKDEPRPEYIEFLKKYGLVYANHTYEEALSITKYAPFHNFLDCVSRIEIRQYAYCVTAKDLYEDSRLRDLGFQKGDKRMEIHQMWLVLKELACPPETEYFLAEMRFQEIEAIGVPPKEVACYAELLDYINNTYKGYKDKPLEITTRYFNVIGDTVEEVSSMMPTNEDLI